MNDQMPKNKRETNKNSFKKKILLWKFTDISLIEKTT